MNNVYFAKEGQFGLSSTECNHLANIAKELQEGMVERLNNVSFYNLSVAVISSAEKQVMRYGYTDLSFVDTDLQRIASLNAFCAWVREAIKEKDRQMSNVEDISFDDWLEMQGIDKPCQPDYPEYPDECDTEDVINSWDINKRNKYLKLEAFAATYGKYIHPNGAYSKARKEAHVAESNPITKEGSGRDTLIYYATPSISTEAVDNLFLNMQSTHRKYEQELNCMKVEIKETVNSLNRDIQAKHNIKKVEYMTALGDYNSITKDLHEKRNAWIKDEQERISKLKIVIPNDLKEIFEFIKNSK